MAALVIVMLVLMLLPVLAIPVFWFLPLGPALAVYLTGCLLAGVTYWLMMRNMKRPVRTGRESFIGREARVIFRSESDTRTPYRVRIEGEIWAAASQDRFEIGDTAVITGVEHNRLTIKRRDHGQGGRT